MKLKSILIVVALLGALSAGVYLIQRPPAPAAADPRLGHPLSQGAPLDQAPQLRLGDQGKQVTLARQPDGSWRVTNYYDFPADFKKISAFVNSLTEATIQRLVTSNPERIARLEFKDTKIELLDNAGKSLWSATLGKNTDLGGRYVRFGDESKAYLAGFTAWIDADAKNWVDSQILELKAEDVSSIEAPLADTRVKISRAKKEDPWTADRTPDGQRVSAAKVSNLLNSIGSLRFVETTEPGDANAAVAKAHERVFKLTTFSGKTYAVALGRKPEDKKLKPPAPASSPTPTPSPGTEAASAPGPKSEGPNPKPPVKTDGDATPEYETIPAGPVFVFVTSSDADAPINAIMQKRAFQISDYAFTSLPQKPEELFEPVPLSPPSAPPKPAAPTTAPVPNPPEPAKKDASEPKKS